MKKKTAAFALFGCFLFSWLGAAPVGLSSARQIAQGFYSMQYASSAKAAVELECVYPSASKARDFVPYYIFNVGEQDGFVIVAGDDNATRMVLGYSDKGSFDMENLPSNVSAWLRYYEEGVRMASVSAVSVPKREESVGEVVVSPLLGDTIQFNQDAPYNGMCPVVGGMTTPTGCAATALSLIAKYYEYPARGRGQVSYTTPTLKLSLSADLSQSEYDWDNMLSSYNGDLNSYTQAEKDAVALLMRDAGYAMAMDYNTDASGAFMPNTLFAAVSHLSYDSLCSIRVRDDYDNNDEWLALLKRMLDNACPIYYSGSSPGGGHAFICDGYDSEDYFHFHWGWGGHYDGYFVVHALNPSGTGIGGGTGGGYSEAQMILFNLVPPGSGKRLSDDFRIEINHVLGNGGLTEGTQNAELNVSLTSFRNWTAADFDGELALAAYQGETFVQLVSGGSEVQLDGVLKNLDLAALRKNVDLKGSATGLADGEYEIWVVSRSAREGSVWNKVHAYTPGLTEVSYIPVTVSSENFVVRKLDRNLTIRIEIPVTKNINVFVYEKGIMLEDKRINSQSGGTISLFTGVPYTLKFHTLQFDTTTITDFSITQDSTITVKINETITDPYYYIARVQDGNDVLFTWKKNPPKGPEVSPQSYILYQDSVPVGTAGPYAPKAYGEYVFENVPVGIHTFQVRSVFYEDTSNYVGVRLRIEEGAGNEDFRVSDCRLSPNPSQDGLFSLEVNRACQVQVLSVSGRTLFTQELPVAGKHSLDLSSYASGMYLIRLVAEDRQSVLLKAFVR